MKANVKYPNFVAECRRRGIEAKDIAMLLNCTPNTARNKMSGRTCFTWGEINLIHRRFFPDVTKDYLMQTSA